jgi:hypothetical protein
MKHARDDYQRIQDPAGLIPDDEPVFLLRGQDALACKTVMFYASLCQSHQAPEIAAKALAHAERMAAWPTQKLPDLAPADQQVRHSAPVGWRCFHCDENFTDRDAARLHFGATEFDKPACQIDIEHVRWVQAQYQRAVDEDTEALRAIGRLASEHETLRRRAEEQGYAKGLDDAKKHPYELGLMVIPADDFETMLLADLSRELKVDVPTLALEIKLHGMGDYSTNMAVPRKVAAAMRQLF